MTRAQCCATMILLLAAGTPARAQNSCNAPAKSAIVHLEMPGAPFTPVVTEDGCRLFVTLANAEGSSSGAIAVVGRDNGTLTLERTVPIKGNPTGAALTHDGKMLIVADGGYIAFLDATRLASGNGDPILGYVGNGSTIGFIYASVTPDDKLAFVSAERAQSIIIVNLERVRAVKQITDDVALGKLDVGNAPIAVTLSPDGHYLYTTSEAAPPEWKWPADCRPEGAAGSLARGGRPPPPFHSPGAIVVFDVTQVLSDPKHAEVARAPAGCNTVRLVLSPDGSTAYASARGENSLLAFDAHRLISDPAHALLGKAEVGVAPVGIAVVDSGARVVVTNSNRFGGGPTDRQSLAVVDAARLKAGGKNAVLGEIQAGGFPRELRVTADGRTLFVTNFTSRTLEMIDLARSMPRK